MRHSLTARPWRPKTVPCNHQLVSQTSCNTPATRIPSCLPLRLGARDPDSSTSQCHPRTMPVADHGLSWAHEPVGGPGGNYGWSCWQHAGVTYFGADSGKSWTSDTPKLWKSIDSGLSWNKTAVVRTQGWASHRREFCLSAAPPSTFSGCFNSDGERASAK